MLHQPAELELGHGEFVGTGGHFESMVGRRESGMEVMEERRGVTKGLMVGGGVL